MNTTATFFHQLSMLANDVLCSRQASARPGWNSVANRGFPNGGPAAEKRKDGGQGQDVVGSFLHLLGNIQTNPNKPKGFSDLISEVHDRNLCRQCGGCVTFCSSMNYGAITMVESGPPIFSDKSKCNECGLCYEICPENSEGRDEVKQMISWSAPFGRVLSSGAARINDQGLRQKTTNGGALAGMLLHLFDTGRIDGVLTARPEQEGGHRPRLAVTREDILESAGTFEEPSVGVTCTNNGYCASNWNRGRSRFAFVGTPCQILTLRKMESLGIMPSENLVYKFGMFCQSKEKKNQQNGSAVDSNDDSCRCCSDYSAEYADVSFGFPGADSEWTTVIARTPLGRSVLTDSAKGVLQVKMDDSSAAMRLVWKKAAIKKRAAVENRSRNLMNELRSHELSDRKGQVA
jgi:coenzyme F420 hydrogenase subunit beta